MAFQADAFQDNQFGFQIEEAIIGAGLPVCDPNVMLTGVMAQARQLITSGDSVLVGAMAKASLTASSGDAVLIRREGTAKEVCI